MVALNDDHCLSTKWYQVRRCDHGNKVKIHVSNLYPLPSSLIGSLAIECTVNDIRLVMLTCQMIIATYYCTTCPSVVYCFASSIYFFFCSICNDSLFLDFPHVLPYSFVFLLLSLCLFFQSSVAVFLNFFFFIPLFPTYHLFFLVTIPSFNVSLLPCFCVLLPSFPFGVLPSFLNSCQTYPYLLVSFLPSFFCFCHIHIYI